VSARHEANCSKRRRCVKSTEHNLDLTFTPLGAQRELARLISKASTVISERPSRHDNAPTKSCSGGEYAEDRFYLEIFLRIKTADVQQFRGHRHRIHLGDGRGVHSLKPQVVQALAGQLRVVTRVKKGPAEILIERRVGNEVPDLPIEHRAKRQRPTVRQLMS
jgi:hypothetical protein